VARRALLAALGDKSWRLRAIAAWGLGRHPQPPVAKALITALRDEHLAVRTNAAGALARLGPAAAKDALRALLRRPNADPHLVANVVLALGKMGDKPSHDAIRRVFKRERTNTYLDRNVLRALSALGASRTELRQLTATRGGDSLEPLLERLQRPKASPAPSQAKHTWVGLNLVDSRGHRKRHVPFLLILSDGRIRWTFSDERGQAYEERIPPGTVHYEQIRQLSY
jgi:HEAT repeat protein